MTAPVELEDVNTVDQAAAYLKVDEAKVRRLVSQRKLGFLKQGYVYTFPREALEAYVKAHTTLATPPNVHGLTDASLRRVRASPQ